MEAMEAIKSRRSIRDYTDEMPSKEILEQIVWAAQHAPNAGPFAITVVTDPELLELMNNTVREDMLAGGGFGKERASLPGYRPLYNAPVCIVFSSDPEHRNSEANTSCAATAAAYAASALGLGSCYVRAPRTAFGLIDNLGELLQLPEGFKPNCGLCVGYIGDAEKFCHAGERGPAVWV